MTRRRTRRSAAIPTYAQGQEFSAFRYGCEPWYGENHFNGDVLAPEQHGLVVEHVHETCPPTASGSLRDQGAGFGVNSSNNPWRCVPTAPGLSTGQIGDDIAVATDNCANINNNFVPDLRLQLRRELRREERADRAWRQNGGTRSSARRTRASSTCSSSRTRRAKGLTGRGRRDPGARLRVLLRHGLGRRERKQDDPCPDTTYDHDRDGHPPTRNMPRAPRGSITGVFVETVEYEPGPVDATGGLRRGPADAVQGHARPLICR